MQLINLIYLNFLVHVICKLLNGASNYLLKFIVKDCFPWLKKTSIGDVVIRYILISS